MYSKKTIVCCAVVIAFACGSNLQAGRLENRFFTIDFTKPEAVGKQVTWTDAEALTATAAGLGFDGERNQSRDVRIEWKQPFAVGSSWQPTTTVVLRAEIEPAGEFRFGENSITYPSTAGVLYARYSPDRKHWSTWQPLSLREPRNKRNPRLVFFGQLRVPGKSRENYVDFLNTYYNKRRYLGDVDEEAAVKALLRDKPDYFAKNKPFIGYVDLMWETQIRGHQRLRKVMVEASFTSGGRAPTPAGHKDGERWRFAAE